MIRPIASFLAACFIAIVPGSDLLWAQSTFSSVLGTVRDATGGVVARCSVSVENTGTSARRSAQTDAGGAYTVPNLEPGPYTITMESQGFQVATSRIELTSRQT